MKLLSQETFLPGGRIISSSALLLVVMCLSSCQGMRGPHHPRNSPRVAPEVSHGHLHYLPKGSPGQPTPVITHDKKLLHDQEHIKEDLGEWVAPNGQEMTPEEMEFHYFKMHDFDNNSMLDGLEILQAISHVLPQEDEKDAVDLTYNINDPKNSEQPHKMTGEEDFNYYIELIDRVLEEDDINKDGYLSYFEYAVGRRREENKEKVLYSSNPVAL